MTKRSPKSCPTWTDVKAKLEGLDQPGLLGLIRDLYSAHKDNQAFLHARFGLAEDVLEPYKRTIEQWLCPDVFGPGDISVSKAKKAISDYKKAIGQPEGVAELMVFYCEQAADFSDEFGLQDDGYFSALVRMFEQALKFASTTPGSQREALVARLDRVRRIGHHFGYGVGDDMDFLLSKYGFG